MLQHLHDLGKLVRQGLEPVQAQLLARIGELADRHNYCAFLVGGPVRDLMLRRQHVDVDIVVEGDGPRFAMALAGQLGAQCRIHERFFTATLNFPDGSALDVATARSETYERPGALPQVHPAGLEQDLARRDFTINSMAMALNPGVFAQIYDPHGGCADLAGAAIRVLHESSFLDDPTRIIRGIGFQVRLGMCFQSHTAELARQAISRGALRTVSGFRISETLMPLLSNSVAVDVINVCEAYRVLGALGLTAAPLDSRLRQALRAVPEALAALGAHNEGFAAALASLALLGCATGAPTPGGIWHLHKRSGALLRNAAQYIMAPPPELDDPGVAPSALYFALEAAALPALTSLWALNADGVRRRNIQRFWRELAPVVSDVTGHDLIGSGAKPAPGFAAALRAALAYKLDHPAALHSAQLQVALENLKPDGGKP